MTVEFASTKRVELLAKIGEEFVEEIFDLQSGDYVISDESELRDFTDFADPDTLPVWKRIKAHFSIDQADVGSNRLLEILLAIERHRNLQ